MIGERGKTRPDGLAPPSLAVGRFVLSFRAREPFTLPDFSAGMWRGVFGLQLKLMSRGEKPAPAGGPRDVPAGKLYEWFFDTPPPNTPLLRHVPKAPHPYVIAAPFHDAPIRVRAGDVINLPVSLLGEKANRLLPAVLLAFQRAAATGLGKQRGRAVLEEVLEETDGADAPRRIYAPGTPPKAPRATPPPAPPAPEFALVELRTPLRLAVRGRLLKPADFSAPAFLMSIVRRLGLLATCHGDGAADVDFRRLKGLCERARIADAHLLWRDQTHYSARARRELPFGGVMGRFVLDLRDAPALWPWLWRGQFVHTGKATTYGLGAFRPLMRAEGAG